MALFYESLLVELSRFVKYFCKPIYPFFAVGTRFFLDSHPPKCLSSCDTMTKIYGGYMVDPSYLQNVPTVTTDKSGQVVVQLPYALWSQFIADGNPIPLTEKQQTELTQALRETMSPVSE